ncbi:MAG TPA: GrpB family protein [Dehalococcoidia bacterium]|nr:GrpB family protein [Dehalococcoidia bacterium]
MSSSILIVAYDPDWPHRYELEAGGIRQALGGRCLALEHIGSTAVAGLAAKPVVDIMAGVTSLADAGACIVPLQRLGYAFHPEVTAQLGMHDDRLFVKTVDGRVVAHLHLTQHGGAFWQEKLLFRDFLRTHPEAARAYAALKRELAPQFSDGPSYSTAKTAFIQATLRHARGAPVSALEPAGEWSGSRQAQARRSPQTQ